MFKISLKDKFCPLLLNIEVRNVATNSILSCFGHLQDYLEIEGKHENNILQRKKDAKQIIINHKGTETERNGED